MGWYELSSPCSGSQRGHGPCGCAGTGAAPGQHGFVQLLWAGGKQGTCSSFRTASLSSLPDPFAPWAFSVRPAQPGPAPLPSAHAPAPRPGCRGYRAAAGASSAWPEPPGREVPRDRDGDRDRGGRVGTGIPAVPRAAAASPAPVRAVSGARPPERFGIPGLLPGAASRILRVWLWFCVEEFGLRTLPACIISVAARKTAKVFCLWVMTPWTILFCRQRTRGKKNCAGYLPWSVTFGKHQPLVLSL